MIDRPVRTAGARTETAADSAPRAVLWARRSGRTPAAFLICILAFSAFLAACNPLAGADCPAGSSPFVEYQLFMGRGGAEGEVVSEDDWAEFLDDTVTPRFPDGLTVLDGYGQWRDGGGQIQQERSKVLILYATGDDDSLLAEIDAISAEYERRFDQESVLRVVDRACVSFS